MIFSTQAEQNNINKSNNLHILYIIHSLSNSFFEVIHFDHEEMWFFFSFSFQKPNRFNTPKRSTSRWIRNGADCLVRTIHILKCRCARGRGGSLQFLEACEHGLAYCFFVGGVGPDHVFLLFPRLPKKRKKKKNSNKLKAAVTCSFNCVSCQLKLTWTGSAPKPGLSLTLCVSLERKI